MPTHKYELNGKRVPGVTTVIGSSLGWSRDGLMYWANKLGLEGMTLNDARQQPVAANIGTAVHDMIECHIQGQPHPTPVLPDESLEIANRAFKRFLRWFQNTRLKVIGTELYGVDAEYRTGWCLDALALSTDLNGKPALDLLDWKTSRGTYGDHVIQTAAYAVFIEKKLSEWFGESVRLSEVHVLRIDKETGAVSQKSWLRDDLEKAWEAFTYLRWLHEEKAGIEALCR